MEFFLEAVLKFTHHLVYLLVGKGFVFILKSKAHGITFLAFRKVFALENIKKIHLFKQFLLGL